MINTNEPTYIPCDCTLCKHAMESANTTYRQEFTWDGLFWKCESCGEPQLEGMTFESEMPAKSLIKGFQNLDYA